MTDDTYEGWKNYPTWAVNLWLANDEGLYYATLEFVADAIDQAASDSSDVLTGEELRHYHVADAFPEFVDTLTIIGEVDGDGPTGLASDLLAYALGVVDWDEIAEHWIVDVLEARANA